MFCKNCGTKLESGIRFCGSCGTAIEEQKLDVSTGHSVIVKRNFNGLDGWLILVGIGLLIDPFILLYNIFAINVPSLSNYPQFVGLITYELIINSAFIIAVVYLIILYLKRSKTFPTYFIVFLSIGFGLFFIDYLLASGVGIHDSSAVVRAGITAVIWIPYMLKSRRVKETFIN